MIGSSLALDLLGTSYVIAGDERIIGLLKLLWAPFKIENPESGSTSVLIEAIEGGWQMQIGSGPQLVGHDIWNFAASFRLAIETDALDAARGLTALHGAVVTRDDAAVLLIGPVATGKTTLALDLIDQGWRLSSDDIAAIDASGQVLSFRRPVSIKGREMWMDFLDRWAPPSWVQEPTHFFQVPATVFPLSDKSSYGPRAMMFPRFEPTEPGSVQVLTPGEATMLAMHHVYRSDPQALSLVSRLCPSIPVARLTYRSSEEALEQVGTVLSLAG